METVEPKMRVLVLGATGMLGRAMLRILSDSPALEVFGTARSESARRAFSWEIGKRILCGVDVERIDSLMEAFAAARPQLVVNCVGVVKQLAGANDPLQVLPINAIFPHRLANMCQLVDARLVHISTDCVFSGSKGNYCEADPPDATDLYGKSKFLGEVTGSKSITLRTSIIGHEVASSRGLVDWFLAQQGSVKGYTKAIFSGLPTVELARVVRDFVVPRPSLSGVYHVASEPIAKYELLALVSKVYGKDIDILPDEAVVIDRSLDGDRFRRATGYVSPSWPSLIQAMFESQ